MTTKNRPSIRGFNLWRPQPKRSRWAVRREPSSIAIREFWVPILRRAPWRRAELDDADACFACSFAWNVPTQRAHILAKTHGGNDHPGNLHLLCPICHDMSESLYGLDYWRWFRRQTFMEAVRYGTAKMLIREGIDLDSLTIVAMIDLSATYASRLLHH